ncbi:MAG: ribonuclease P protein component [Clostridia bacterium]|nr:ribonuclease P protein component [Clostridia bacterium]
MKYTKSIKDDRVFRYLYRKGASVATPTVVVYYRKNRQSINQLGLTTAKKIGNAVQRNRARRVMREAYRLLEEKLEKNCDIVLVARSKTPFVLMDEVKCDMLRAFEKAGIIAEKQEKNENQSDPCQGGCSAD